jgi:hypothetical protein
LTKREIGAASKKHFPVRSTRRRLEQPRPARSRRAQIEDGASIIIRDAKRFAFFILVSGASYIQMEHFFLWNKFIPPSKSSFYRARQELFEVIKANASLNAQIVARRFYLAPSSLLMVPGSIAEKPWSVLFFSLIVEQRKLSILRSSKNQNAAFSQITQELRTEWKLPLC